MKVLLINGSPRENGNTFLALSEVAKTLNEEGVATKMIHIGKQPIPFLMYAPYSLSMGRNISQKK